MNSNKGYKSLGTNALLNAIKSSLSIIFPLVTYPYIFRVLHAEGVGKFTYANSIVSYFSLLAVLGINTYAVREGAKLREDKKKVEVFINQLFTINIISTVIAYILLFALLFFTNFLSNYKDIIFVLSLTMLFTTLSADWINTIYEDFLIITLRSIAIYAISLILIFVLIRDDEDVLLYSFITVFSGLITCLMNRIYCKRYARIRLTKTINYQTHLPPILFFFINNIAVNIYVNSDTTMIGYMIGDYYVGLYSIAVRIYSVIKALLAALYLATIPRLSSYIGSGEKEKFKSTFSNIVSLLSLVLLPASIGLIMVSKEIILIFGGTEYLASITTLRILSISLIGAIAGGAITMCLNVPFGYERINMYATMLSCIINVGLNFWLIPNMKQDGAAITTAISEFFVAIFCIINNKEIKDCIDLIMVKRNLKDSLIGCITVACVSFFVRRFVSSGIIKPLVTVVSASIVLYIIELILSKNVFIIRILHKRIKT